MASSSDQRQHVPPSYSDPRDGVYSYDKPVNKQDRPNTLPTIFAYDQPSDRYNFPNAAPPRQYYPQTALNYVVDDQPVTQINCETVSPPPTYFVLSLLASLFCCSPIGLCAIVTSVSVNNAIAHGDMEDAKRWSKYTRSLIFFTIIIGVFFIAGLATFFSVH